jgi:hypothetical protein
MIVPGQRNDGSPASLALASFGAGRFAKIGGEEQEGDWAVVLVVTNEEPHVVPYEIVFRSDGGRWADVAGNDSPGWRSAGDGSGFVTCWGEAPAGTSQVTVSYHGSMSTVPVMSGYFLAIFWGIRASDFDPSALPQVVTSG